MKVLRRMYRMRLSRSRVTSYLFDLVATVRPAQAHLEVVRTSLVGLEGLVGVVLHRSDWFAGIFLAEVLACSCKVAEASSIRNENFENSSQVLKPELISVDQGESYSLLENAP